MIKLYNTLTGKKEEFVPLVPKTVRMYVCGVTVYDYCHIGHARSALVFDVIRRYLEYSGYRVEFAKNFTDVDDKIIKRANEQGVSCDEVTVKFIQAYYDDMSKLGVRPASNEPKATEHMADIIRLTETLIAKGLAYQVDGRALAAVGDTAGAEGCFRKALALAPDRADPAFNLGVLDLGRDDLVQAKAWFERAIALSPQSADARVNLAIVLRRQGELVPAEAELRRARALAPRDAAVLTELARILSLRAQPDAAREHYIEAIQANPRFAAAHEGLAALCAGLGHTAEAIAHLRATLEIEPDNVPAAAALANSLFEAGNVAEAFETASYVRK